MACTTTGYHTWDYDASVERDTTGTEYVTPKWWKPYAGEFPDWQAWRGVSGLYYAKRPRTSPPVIVHGEDPRDLRDEILRNRGIAILRDLGD